MADTSTIEWTDATWNPVTGCDRVSPGCANCYALTLAKRLKAMGVPGYQRDGDPKTSGPGFGVTLHPSRLDQPLRWKRPRMIFVNSMSDLFHEEIDYHFIREVFNVMRRCDGGIVAATGKPNPSHIFQVLTKRPERAHELWRCRKLGFDAWPSNVWLGTSIENDRWVGRADVLRQIPAAVRFISAEPLLKPLPSLNLDGIDWLIAGGESGKGHRPMAADWVRDLRDRCAANGTAFFFKQWGGATPKAGGRELDGRTWDEMPVVA